MNNKHSSLPIPKTSRGYITSIIKRSWVFALITKCSNVVWGKLKAFCCWFIYVWIEGAFLKRERFGHMIYSAWQEHLHLYDYPCEEWVWYDNQWLRKCRHCHCMSRIVGVVVLCWASRHPLNSYVVVDCCVLNKLIKCQYVYHLIVYWYWCHIIG